MTSTKFSDFWTPSTPFFAFGTYDQWRNHATSLTSPPPSANIIYGSSLPYIDTAAAAEPKDGRFPHSCEILLIPNCPLLMECSWLVGDHSKCEISTHFVTRSAMELSSHGYLQVLHVMKQAPCLGVEKCWHLGGFGTLQLRNNHEIRGLRTKCITLAVFYMVGEKEN